MKLRKENGFTLIELLIALVVLGILISLAVPRYEKIVHRAKKAEAKLMLNTLHDLEKSYYLEHDIYTSDFEKLGFVQEDLVSDGGKARYLIEVQQADRNGYRAVAQSIVDFDRDGVLNLWTVSETGNIVEEVAD